MKARLILTGCMLLLASILLVSSYGTYTALAAQYDQTPTTQNNEYNQASGDTTNYCEDIGYLPPSPDLTEAENRGRCTWYLWTGGNEKFYHDLSVRTDGSVNLLSLLDSRQHDER